MKEIEITSTSSKTADGQPISLRSTDKVRLVFIPTLVKNSSSPQACVRGRFVYQKKNKNSEWESLTEFPLSSLKSGEGYQLELHSSELFVLMKELVQLYRLYGQVGIPKGKTKFVKLEASLARFFALGEVEIRAFLESHPEDATETLMKLLRWLASSPNGVSKFADLAPTELPNFTSLIGLASLKSALKYWTENQSNKSEEFWQNALEDRAYVLSQAYAYPIVVISPKAYMGGKQFSNKGGNLADFLVATELTNSVLVIEIKTPSTKLLGPQYREGVYPFSADLSGAIAQVLNYQRSLALNFHAVASDTEKKLLLGEPRCLVVAGNAREELANDAMRQGFELQRQRLQGLTVVTYDELFLKLRRLIELLEPSTIS